MTCSVSNYWNWTELRLLALREARRVLPEQADAEDAAQEAVIRAYRAQQRCDSPDAPQAWMRTIARREAYRTYALRQRDGGVLVELPPESVSPDIADGVMGEIAAGEILGQVDDSERSLLIRRYLLEQTSGEIAAELGIPAATVRVQLHRATKRVRAQHAEDLAPQPYARATPRAIGAAA
jgi:RNA polymerase sigma-70 factor, ECF subfamily